MSKYMGASVKYENINDQCGLNTDMRLLINKR